MPGSEPIKPQKALRGAALTFTGDPFEHGADGVMRYESDAIVAFGSGLITHFGPASLVAPQLGPDVDIVDCGADALITAGFLDSHVHFAQTPMIASHGAQLLDWLEKYTFPMERRFDDPAFARSVAKMFLRECLRNGITTACVYGTVHPVSVDVLFEEAAGLDLRLIAGKALMDRNAPLYLRDTAQIGHDQSLALIEKWHGKGRLSYAVTPRFAATSTPEQLELAGAIGRAHPEVYIQTHIAENVDEVQLVRRLFPERRSYLDVYDHYGLCRPRSILAHGIHLSEDEIASASAAGAAIAHCPTSNFFLGSGCFDIARTLHSGRRVRVGIGTDVGAGTSFSIMDTLGAAYKAAQMNRYALNPAHAVYLATRGTAHALYIEDKVGSLATGMEADIVVLDMRSTPLIDYRMDFANSIEEALFIQVILGDDRVVKATYVAGVLRYDRDTPAQFF